MLGLLILVLSYCCNVVGSLNDEGIALLSFKNSIKEDPGGSLNNWNSSDVTPCSWNGITCEQQRVVSVSIRGNSFSGVLPFEVGNIQYLQTLDLSQNFFKGSLPTSLIQCKRLRNLDLSRNNFSGSLPSGFGRSLVSLEKLDLSYNDFDGSVPSDLGDLSNLQGTLDLSHNMFNGSIPSSIGNLPEKIYIDLSYNRLSGPIPQYGALINRGPTAFIGNPGLCGPPLKNLCCSDTEASSPSSFPYLPDNYPSQGGGKGGGQGLSKAAVISVIISVIGSCVIGLLFSYCYSRICFCGKRKDENAYSFKKRGEGSKECLCFRKDESKTLSKTVKQYDLVPLDAQAGFDLDELLKASAFVLGKSRIGIVYKVVLENGLTLAVRRLGEGGPQRFKEFKTEVEAIAKLRHPNIVPLRAHYWSADEKLLIYDFIPNGNLANAIHGKPGLATFTPLPWSMRLKIIKGVAKGLVYLHEYSPKKYVHGDLKPSNILLGQDMEPKISDFGLGRLTKISSQTPTLQPSVMVAEIPLASASEVASFASAPSLGSYYQAPEARKVMKPSQRWDVYSYGMILLEMITGRSPSALVGNSEMDLVRLTQPCIDEKKPVSDVLDPNLAPDADKEEDMIEVLRIAIACTQSKPERRHSMRHVLDALERFSVVPSD